MENRRKERNARINKEELKKKTGRICKRNRKEEGREEERKI